MIFKRKTLLSAMVGLFLVSLGFQAGVCGSTVPSEFQDLYSFLEQKLDAFDKTLSSKSTDASDPVTFAAEVLTANGNRGKAVLRPQAMKGTQLELDRLKGLGVQAAVVRICFPLFSADFFKWSGEAGGEQQFIDVYKKVAQEVRQRGMKLIVEAGPMFGGPYSAKGGFQVMKYYPTLSDDQYIAARTQDLLTIAREIQPDYINLGSEPDTEFRLTHKSFMRSPAAYARMISTFVNQVHAAGIQGVALGAGTGTWNNKAGPALLEELCKIDGLDAIDLHHYPVNRNFQDNAIAFAETAHAHGKKVTMTEAWLQKERDAELGVMDSTVDQTVFSRDAYSFWAPLDQKFLTVMAKFCRVEKVQYFSPFWDKYFFAYVDYDQVASRHPTANQLAAYASKLASQAMRSGGYTSTGQAYRTIIHAQSK